MINQELNPINENEYLWRYIGLDTFLSILKNKKIYFPTPAQFKDPNEIMLESHDGDSKNLKDKTCLVGVSCWHINEYENILMWKTYTSSNYAIVVKVKFENLSNFFKVKPKPQFKRVEYISVKSFESLKRKEHTINENINYESFLFSKTIGYKSENELRVIAVNPDYWEMKKDKAKRKLILEKLRNKQEGFYVKVDLNCIYEVILHPQFSEPMKLLIQAYKERLKLKFEIKPSIVKEKLQEK